MKYLVHRLVREMFWKEYGHNKDGVLEHPLLFALVVLDPCSSLTLPLLPF